MPATPERSSEIESLTFEQAYAELEHIIQQLDEGALPLEQSVTLFERGRQLTAYCQELLDRAELRVSQLTDSGGLEDL